MTAARKAELSRIWRSLPANDDRGVVAMDELAREAVRRKSQ